MRFGQWLRARREETGRSLRKIAAEVGCSPAYLSALELGHQDAPTPSMQIKIADAIGIDHDEMRRRGYEGRTTREVLEVVKGHPHQDQLARLLKQTRSLSAVELATLTSAIENARRTPI